MRLKSFSAKTMTEAMRMVRDSLGDEAIIVATREDPSGGLVRVTAAVDRDVPVADDDIHFDLEKEEAPAKPNWLQYDDEDEDQAVAEKITDALLNHGVPEEVLEQIVTTSQIMGLENAHVALVAALEGLFRFKPLPREKSGRATMLLGAPGSGKTLAAAKIAARAAMAGQKVAVISADTQRAGGFEQLEAFTKILNTPLHKVESAEDLDALLTKLTGHDQIIIDMPGANPFDIEDMRYAGRMARAGAIDPVLVLAGGCDADESGEIARVFASIGVNKVLATRLDIARRVGCLLAAAHHGNLAFTDASKTAQVADGLFTMKPNQLADIILPATVN